MFIKVKNIFFLCPFMFSINLVSSENMIDPETLTTGALESLAVDVKNILDKRKDKVTDKESAFKEMSKIEENAKAKDENIQRKILNYIKDLKQSLESKPESLDDSINSIEVMEKLSKGIPYNLPEEAKEVGRDLTKLADAIIDIKKEEARGKVSPEEWKKLPIMKLFRYFRYLDYGDFYSAFYSEYFYCDSKHLPVDNSNPIIDAFMKAIKSDSLDYSSVLKQEDFDIIIPALWSIIFRSDMQYDETVMTDKKNDINNKNPESKLFYQDALAFMKKLVKESKISDKKSFFSDYVKHSFKYGEYMSNPTYSLESKSGSTNADMFRKEMANNFAGNLSTDSWLDYLYKLFNSGGLSSLLTLPIAFPIKLLDSIYGELSK